MTCCRAVDDKGVTKCGWKTSSIRCGCLCDRDGDGVVEIHECLCCTSLCAALLGVAWCHQYCSCCIEENEKEADGGSNKVAAGAPESEDMERTG